MYLLGVLVEVSFLDIGGHDLRGFLQDAPLFILPYSFKDGHGSAATKEPCKDLHSAIHPVLMLYRLAVLVLGAHRSKADAPLGSRLTLSISIILPSTKC
jgi:hypothetical protein